LANKIIRLCRKVERNVSNTINNCFFYNRFISNAEEGMIGIPYKGREIVCSITTIPKRIQFVKYPILSMLHQSIVPNRIILYLGKDQFHDIDLPSDITELVDDIFNIEFVEDVMVHTKYYYAFKEHNDSLIITVDDDIVYNRNLVRELLAGHVSHPKSVVCTRAHGITYDKDYSIEPYQKWDWDIKLSKPSNRLVATGVGGVLYDPKLFKVSPCQKELFLKLSKKNDDLWLKTIEIINNIPIYTIQGRHWYAEISDSQEISLNSDNVHHNVNDQYIKVLFEHFNISKDHIERD